MSYHIISCSLHSFLRCISFFIISCRRITYRLYSYICSHLFHSLSLPFYSLTHSKDFKSVEQIEQHFNSKAHKKLVQEDLKRKQEAERRRLKNAANKLKKLEKARASELASGIEKKSDSREEGTSMSASGSVSVSDLSLSSLPPTPPLVSVSAHATTSQRGSTEEQCGDESSESESDEEDEDDDDDYLLLHMASAGKRAQQGLPDMDSGSDSDIDGST